MWYVYIHTYVGLSRRQCSELRNKYTAHGLGLPPIVLLSLAVPITFTHPTPFVKPLPLVFAPSVIVTQHVGAAPSSAAAAAPAAGNSSAGSSEKSKKSSSKGSKEVVLEVRSETCFCFRVLETINLSPPPLYFLPLTSNEQKLRRH